MKKKKKKRKKGIMVVVLQERELSDQYREDGESLCGVVYYIPHELAEREGGKQSKGKEQIKGK